MLHRAAATKWKLLEINSILSRQTQHENGRLCARAALPVHAGPGSFSAAGLGADAQVRALIGVEKPVAAR